MWPRSTYPRLIVIFSVSGAFGGDCFTISMRRSSHLQTI